MNMHIVKSLPDAEVFKGTRPVSLAEVMARADAGLGGNTRRDTLSAFCVLAAKAKVDLAATPATPAEVRSLFEAFYAGCLDIKPKRLANIRSLISGAVERFGSRRIWITKEIVLDENWQQLIDMIPKREYGWSLSRLACFCTASRVRPDEVGPETLRGLHEALEAECLVRKPRGIIKQTIGIWNHCRRNVPGWPPITLSSPFRTESYMLPLSDFPESFQSDIAAWEQRMLNPDPLNPDAPLRAMRAPTLEGYRFTFRRLASALVRSVGLQVNQITGLETLCRTDNLKEGLRPFLQPDGNGYAYKMAIQMRHVARYFLKLDPVLIDAIDKIAGRLAPREGRAMGRRNRTRLAQFDDAAVVQRLLQFPEKEYGRAVALRNPVRRAKGIERALAISLLIYTGIRVKNLRSLRLDGNILRRGGRVFVSLADGEMKSGNALELELPGETIRLLDAFLEHRDRFAGANGPYLFPGPDGLARSYSAMREAVSKPLLKHAGIGLSPHLYRHIIAKIVAERAPGMLPDVSRMLGHKSINTTYQSYLGTETPAASRRINQLLQETRARPELGGDH